MIINLAIGGISAYALCRELGVSRPAALCGALSFQLGTAALNLTTWTPMVAAPYVWLPAALLFCERILRRPSVNDGLALGATLAIALLPGFPQTVFFACQLIALRVLWEFATRRSGNAVAAMPIVALGFVLAPLLAAVLLLPGIEMASTSVRGTGLSVKDITATGYLDWTKLRQMFGMRWDMANPLVVLPGLVAAASVMAARTRRVALFYACAGLLYFALSFGPGTPLFGWYLRLPLGALFRDPLRFLWLTSFCLAVLAAFGVDALVGRAEARSSHAAAVIASGTALIGLHYLSPSGLLPSEWTLAVLAIGAAACALWLPAARRIAAFVLVGAVALNLLWFPLSAIAGPQFDQWAPRALSIRRLVADGSQLWAQAATFTALRDRMSAQDRAYLVYDRQTLPFEAKTAALFGVPAVQDYEPQPSLRYARYFTMMRIGRDLTSLNDYYYLLQGMMPQQFRRRLLDLGAARYLVVAANVDSTATVLSPPPGLLFEDDELRVYENPLALPRAAYIPRIEVMADDQALLQRLANGNDDLRTVAFVEQDLPSGFRGVATNQAGGTVQFVRNDPEHVVLRVQAPERGFLHLADQYAAGWQATVDGQPAPIARANFLFRIVEVPAGESVVEFRYAPRSVLLGATVSTLTLLAVGGFVVWRRLARNRFS
jgi:hypothetical protein